MGRNRAIAIVLVGGLFTACVEDEGGPGAAKPSDASADSRSPYGSGGSGGRSEGGVDAGQDAADSSAGEDTGPGDGSAGEDSGPGDGSAGEDSGPGDGSPGTDAADAEGGSAGPTVWLAYIADPTADVDELWAVRVSAGRVEAPVRVNAPLQPNQDVTWMRWTDDGKQLVYRLGTDESTLFVVDMTGPAPGSPRRLDGVGRFPTWSPNGRYLAYLTGPTGSTSVSVSVVDLSEPALTVHSAPFCSNPDCSTPIGLAYPPDQFLAWTADSEWLYGEWYESAIWGVHVASGRPEPPEVLVNTSGGSLAIRGIYPEPFGAGAAVRVHLGASGGRHYITRIGTSPTNLGESTGAAVNTYFDRWLPNGEFVYWGTPYGALDREPQDFYFGSSQRVFDVTGPRISWKPAPDSRTLALVVDDANPSEAALYLRRFDAVAAPPDPPTPEWGVSRLAIADFSKSYEWAPDSRQLLYAKSSLFVLDTVGPTLPPPRELAGSIPAGASASSIAWGRVSNRIFYIASNARDLRYIDYRDGAAESPAMLTPSFAHAAGDAVAWQLSTDDSYVASNGDFARDGVFELYVTSVAGSAAGAPQRVHPAFSNGQAVTAFAWQP